MRAPADDVPARTGQVPVLRSRVVRPDPTGLRRARLLAPLVGPVAPHLVAVVAGPGCGKTTLLAHVADASGLPVAWLTLDPALDDPAALLEHLRAACDVLPWRTPPGSWRTPDDALAALGDGLTAPVLLVLDDVHTTERRRAAQVVDVLVRHQPAGVRLVLGTRGMPAGLPSRELAGTARVLDGEALRFRTWEVDELFRGHHASPLRAAEVAELTQRTRGWAAGLELFHLATRDRPASSRTRLLERAGRGPAVADYLAGHVLDRLPLSVREFLVRTSVLGRLSAERCDALLGTDTGARLLAAAHRHGLLAAVDEADGTQYECHDVLRGYLLDTLTERAGGAVARELHRRAAALALTAGEYDDALRSSCRAQDWDAARRVLTIGGDDLAGRPGPWLDLLPGAIRESDPWVALALARRHLVDGALDPALVAYAVAEERAVTGSGRALVTRERHMVRTWVEPPMGASNEWVALVRRALARPREAMGAGDADDVGRALASAVAGLVGGDVRVAARRFAAVQGRAAAQPVVEAVALLGEAACLTLMHDRGARDARERAHTAAKLVGAPALERLADGLELGSRPATGSDGLRHLQDRCVGVGDAWGTALLGLLDALGGLTGAVDDPRTAATAQRAAADLDALGAPALAAWAHAAAAVAQACHGQAPQPVGVAVDAARWGPVPHALALIAVGEPGDRWGRLARAAGAPAWVRLVAARRGARPGPVVGEAAAPGAAPVVSAVGRGAVVLPEPSALADRLSVRCLGDFRLDVGGQTVTTASLRPQHAALLRALALHAPAPVHRDRLVEWFWPGRVPERGQHSLQVAVSDVRRALDAARAGAGGLLRRVEQGYALGVDGGTDHDVRRLERVLRAAEVALGAGDDVAALVVLREAVDTGTAELLPQDGPAEWVVGARERVRSGVLRACAALADLLTARGDTSGTVAVVRRGLALDRFQDDLWRRLVGGLVADGRPAAAAAARREYAAVLQELGVTIALPAFASPPVALRTPPPELTPPPALAVP
ncbi:BTAD domain-containing putative transcriptional regulator [Cellulomonas sp. S1-8]|uniref:BTAD domain-containing putative transcriptional regulator n=1 Tax=Cellulomonas sp. S1-8 TaxID=2904790 RepID=UPI0022431FFF|nr:BTAD domain-containing putative transcriptional regulator [Cellulomonas sp. S1-8]UZN02569.1 winged helix-turn-helix domain-containing protein [Cellulomonas sp. S1-8]